MIVQLAGVRKSYGRKRALNPLQLDFKPGQVIAVLGENGAGKSTFLQMLAGILVPSDGQILYDGEVFRRDRVELRRRLYFLPDFPVFFAGTTVLKHLAMMLDLFECNTAATQQRVAELLEKFDLLSEIRAPLEMLSRGQIYKVALVGMIAVQPELWLLDEPLASGMDPRGLKVLREEVAAAARQGATILFTSQIIAAAEQMATDVLILHQADLKVFAPLDQLRQERQGNPDLETIFERLLE